MGILPLQCNSGDMREFKISASMSKPTQVEAIILKSLKPNEKYWFRCSDDGDNHFPKLTAHRVVRSTMHTNYIWFRDYQKGRVLKRILLDGNATQFQTSVPSALSEYKNRKLRQARMNQYNMNESVRRAQAVNELLGGSDRTVMCTSNRSLLFPGMADDYEIDEALYQSITGRGILP